MKNEMTVQQLKYVTEQRDEALKEVKRCSRKHYVGRKIVGSLIWLAWFFALGALIVYLWHAMVLMTFARASGLGERILVVAFEVLLAIAMLWTASVITDTIRLYIRDLQTGRNHDLAKWQVRLDLYEKIVEQLENS